MADIDIALAVEKVLFRLALCEGGRVSLARAFLELPLAIEVLEVEADKAANGTAILKDDFGEFLAYDFIELKSAGQPIAPPNDCPCCGRPMEGVNAPLPLPPPPPGGTLPPMARSPLVCDPCYRSVRRSLAHHHETGALERLKHFWKGEEEQDPLKIALVEHEIFYIALRLGGENLTSTSIAAQTRLPAAQVKERLDRLAGRRYIRQGLVPSGDALAYRFPPALAYPEPLWRRAQGAVLSSAEESISVSTAKKVMGAFNFKMRPSDTRQVGGPIDPTPPPPPAPPPPPPAPKINIVVKDKRDRGRPPAR